MTRSILAVAFAIAAFALPVAADDLAREHFKVADHNAFIIKPARAAEVDGAKPWILYAITLSNRHPNKDEKWMFDRFAAAGIAVAGVDVGESFGSPKGRAVFTALYEELTSKHGYSKKPGLLARSRGGLQIYNWAVEHPEAVAGIAGIYPVSNLESYPGLKRAAPAYGMTPEQLKSKLAEHNPNERLAPLAKARVPIFHIQGDIDKVVPHERNSAVLAERYAAMGGPVEIQIIKGQGHNMWRGWFESQKLTDFLIAAALGKGADANAKQTVKPGARVTLRGKLQGGIAAIGGETTGWMLAYQQGGKTYHIDVDMSGVRQGPGFGAAEVTVTGTIYSKQYVERGPTSILKAEKIER